MKNLTLFTAFALIVITGYARAAITTERKSNDFAGTLEQIEGDVDPTTLSDWSIVAGAPTIQNVTGGTFELVTPGTGGDHALGTAGGTDNISSSTGWTWETRFRIDSANETGPAGNSVWEIFMRDNDGGSLSATRIQFYAAGIGRDSYSSGLNPEKLFDLTDDFHVIRGVVEGGTNNTSVWINGYLFIDGQVSQNYNSSEFIRWGEWSANNTGGTSTIDYIRFDTTGGYAPEAVATNSVTDMTLLEGTSEDYTVVLKSQPAEGATVSVIINANDPNVSLNDVADAPITLDFDSANWDQPKTVTVKAIEDSEGEDTESLWIFAKLSDPNLGMVSMIKLTVFDNDTAGILVEPTDVSNDIAEGGVGGLPESDTFDVSLLVSPTSNLVIDIFDPSDPNDMTVSPSQLVFEPGDVGPKTVTVTAIDDDVVEWEVGVNSLTMTLTTDDLSYSSLGNQSVAVNIYDNECGSASGAIHMYHRMDMNHDCHINLLDFSILAHIWLDCSMPNDPSCSDHTGTDYVYRAQ